MVAHIARFPLKSGGRLEATDGIAEDLYLLGPLYRDDQPENHSSRPVGGKPIALAICLAALRAKLSQEKNNAGK